MVVMVVVVMMIMVMMLELIMMMMMMMILVLSLMMDFVSGRCLLLSGNGRLVSFNKNFMNAEAAGLQR